MNSFASGSSPSGNQPHVDTRLEEHDESKGGTLYVLLDVPQYSKDELSIRHSDNKLQVAAPADRGRRRLNKTIQLPISADVDNITASYNNGVLTVSVPLSHLDDNVETAK